MGLYNTPVSKGVHTLGMHAGYGEPFIEVGLRLYGNPASGCRDPQIQCNIFLLVDRAYNGNRKMYL